MRVDWLLTFLSGVALAAAAMYLIWRAAGMPPPEP